MSALSRHKLLMALATAMGRRFLMLCGGKDCRAHVCGTPPSRLLHRSVLQYYISAEVTRNKRHPVTYANKEAPNAQTYQRMLWKEIHTKGSRTLLFHQAGPQIRQLPTYNVKGAKKCTSHTPCFRISTLFSSNFS